ncbi:hypothetical protein JTB14_024104 [Gonioctena quinquepunctata]|nr:hypothetical protein JTB14_024104 [Gonioctena quinquepunctata]
MMGSRGKKILKLCSPSYGQNLGAGSKIHKDDDRACPIQQNVQKTDVLRDITQYPSTSGTQKQMNISDLKDSGEEEDVTSGSEYFPASDDEDPEESVSRQQIAYKRNIVKVKWKVFSEKTHNLQKDIQENTSIAETNEEEIETSGAERENVGTSPNRKEKSIVIHVTADGLNVKKPMAKQKYLTDDKLREILENSDDDEWADVSDEDSEDAADHVSIDDDIQN